MSPAAQPQFPRDLKDMVTPRKEATPNHIGPARSHFRSQTEKFQQKAPPGASFPRKLTAFLSTMLGGWIINYLAFRFGSKHAFQKYSNPTENGIYKLAGDSFFGAPANASEDVRVSLAGDWGTGTFESDAVAKSIGKFSPHFTIHLGDVYYVGDEDELEANCLGNPPGGGTGVTWPVGSNGAFAMNGNHEMYANGDAYFQSFLPALGVRPAAQGKPGAQKASFFCLRNDFWDLIAIDTGYNSVGLPIIERIFKPNCKLENDLLDWLRQVVKPADSKRGIVVISHHQYYSAFEDSFTKPAQQLAEMINRPVLWFWGHEHRMAVYGKAKADSGIEAFGRCIGHGGMPVDIHKDARTDRNFPLAVYDDREYEDLDGSPVGFNGFANLTFNGNTLAVEYRDLENNLLLTEKWEVASGQLSGKEIQQIEPSLTKVTALEVAIGRTT